MWVGNEYSMRCELKIRSQWDVSWKWGVNEMWVGNKESMRCELEMSIQWDVSWK